MSNDLAKLGPDALEIERIEAHLASCEDLDEVKRIRDQAMAIAGYQRARTASRRGAQRFDRIRLRAEVRLGELLKLSTKNEGARGGGSKNSPRGSLREPRDTTPTLASQGITKKDSSRWQAASTVPADVRDTFVRRMCEAEAPLSTTALADLAPLSPAKQREIVSRASSPREVRTEARRVQRIAKLGEIAKGNKPLLRGGGPWPVIYVDPPWRYEHAESESRAIENQYPTMALEEICDLKIGPKIATPDAVLFLWATSPKLAEALRVVDAWGFVYRTNAVWRKDKIGMGYYFRQQHELLLVCTRGQPPAPAPGTRLPSVIDAPRGKHSAKPEKFAEAIECMYPEVPRVELFARSPRVGWAAWGNQAVEAS